MANVVKINTDLLKRVKKIVKDKNMRIKYANVKQFINVAVLDKLEKEKGGNKDLERC